MNTQTETPKKKKVSYKPNLLKLARREATLMSKDVAKVKEVHVERHVVKMVLKGKTFDQVSDRLGISTNKAHSIIKDTLAKWITEQALSSVELREIMIRQIDSVLALAMHEAFPHPMVNEIGEPVMIKFCTCPQGECSDPIGHAKQGMTSPDKQWADMVMSILDRKAKLLGLDAAQKLEEQKVDLMERIYRGVDPKVIEGL